MKNYVISLSDATDRRLHITQEFGKRGIDFVFFDAITPKTLQSSYQKLGLLDCNIANLSKNEQACFASHVCLWQKMLDDNLDYMAIFEDDIYLSQDAHLFLNHSNWIKKDWDLIKLEKVNHTVLLSLNKIQLHSPYTLARLKSYHLGAGGYILSKNIARQLLNHIKSSQKIDHIDQILFKDVLNQKLTNIYQINPVLCIQDCILNPNEQKFISSLQWRQNTKQKPKISIAKKIIREINRIHHDMISIPYKTKLKFYQ